MREVQGMRVLNKLQIKGKNYNQTLGGCNNNSKYVKCGARFCCHIVISLILANTQSLREDETQYGTETK